LSEHEETYKRIFEIKADKSLVYDNIKDISNMIKIKDQELVEFKSKFLNKFDK